MQTHQHINTTMASNSFNLLFLFNLTTTKAQDPPFVVRFCQEATANTTYLTNLKTFLSSLASNAATNTFHNDTLQNTVYSLFMCRDDVPPHVCAQCVLNAIHKLSSDPECSLSKQTVIWYDDCMVHYSNAFFFSTITTKPSLYSYNIVNISNHETTFMSLLSNTMK
ncbi:Cysteine-rich receptor protein kinase 25 [Spatholobus suberectus]|nr:Cysteine-rich receptor protein kinase 25 [Spatholobus suberectus]